MTNKTKTPHTHAELIKAWADGAKIQYFSPVYGEWADNDNPTWSEAIKYRIKPEEQKHEELHLSDGELALIRAIRKAGVSYVWQHGCAILVDKEDEDFETHHDFIALLSSGVEADDDVIREALNTISKEQEEAKA